MTSEKELKLLKLLETRSLGEAAKDLGLGDGTYSVANALQAEGLINLSERSEEVIALDKEGKLYAKEGLPEVRALEKLKKGPLALKELGKETPIVIMWLKKKGWATIDQGKLVITEQGKKADKGKDQELLEMLTKVPILKSKLKGYEDAIQMLSSRQDNITIKESKVFSAELTSKGKSFLKKPVVGD
jgi:hypothetical protein